MFSKEQAKIIFDATSQNKNKFNLFFKILSMSKPTSTNFKELLGQISYIINSKNGIAFTAKSNSLYEYTPFNESKKGFKLVYEITQNIESIIDKDYLFVLGSDSEKPLQELCKKMIKESENILRVNSRKLGQNMHVFQKRMPKKDKNKLQDEFFKNLYKTSSDIIRQHVSSYIDKQTRQFEDDLKKWKMIQLKTLEKKLTDMVPASDYWFVYGGDDLIKITPQTGKAQAKKLAHKIVELVYEKRLSIFKKFRKQPTGGSAGNRNKTWYKIKGEMDCADWTSLFYLGLQEIIEEYFYKNLNSFRVEWRRNPPAFMGHGEHNYIRILGPDKSNYLVLDPWPSGGKKIIPKAENKQNWLLIKNSLYKLDGKTFAYPGLDKFQ